MKCPPEPPLDAANPGAVPFLEQATSRRQFLSAVGAGGALLLLPGFPGTATARRRVRVAEPEDSVVIRWNEAFLQGVRDSKLGPPMVARALAIAHTCIYDAWAAYDHKAVGTRLGGSLRRPLAEHTLANTKQAISFAAYRAAVDLFPASTTSIFDPLMRSLGYDAGDRSSDASTPTGIGNVAARAVLDFRHRDGANQLGDEPGGIPGVPYSDYTGYTPANDPMDIRAPFDPTTVHDPNSWQPLRYVDGSGNLVTPGFVGAQWQRVTTFAVSPGSLRSPTGPARYGSAEYRAQAQALLDLSAGLTDEQKMIAEYWADGPRSELPPGHWNLFAQFVSRRDHHGIQRARPRARREALLRAHERRLRRGLLRLGQQASLQLRPPDHRHPHALPWPGRCARGPALPGHEADRRRLVVSLPADDLPHAPLPRVLVRAQQLQCRRAPRSSSSSPTATASAGR